MTRTTPPLRAAACAAAAALLLATACSPGGTPPDDDSSSTSSTADPTDPAADPAGLETFYDQELAFGPCEDYGTTPTHQEAVDAAVATSAAECARATVPLDYDDPGGETAEIAVIRIPARGGDPIGSLLTNPGGPGGSGVYSGALTAQTLAASPVTERFDLIGFDPRGVGRSTPAIDCHTDAEADDGSYPLSAIMLASEFTAQDTAAIFERCAELSGGEQALQAMGTRDAARDMDVLRAALGDERLTYLGQSYGTRLGAVYAEQFPQRVRAMVLDGAADPTQSTYERRVAAYTGFQRAFEEMAAFCAEQGDCPLGDDPAGAVAAFHDLARPLAENPVPAGESDEFAVGFDEAVNGVTAGLYAFDAWPAIIEGLRELQQGRGDILTLLTFSFGQRDAGGTWPNFAEANYAINCRDEVRMTPEEVAALREEIYDVAPLYDPGVDLSDGARDTCEAWPQQPDLGFPHAVGIEGLPELLVVSITGDATTPHAGGIALADVLGASLLTVEGEQHTITTQGNQPCVDDAVARYLIDLTVPEEGASCGIEPVPTAAPAAPPAGG
ncbi:alpha/beta hydrolase [Litorihabitans aurantiacus]|nr:alpha/beta hydrolase [Litorihabitans aurantiacus]